MSRIKIFTLLIALLFLMGLVLTGCGGGSKSKAAAPGGDTIKIGAILPMTGPAAVFGKKFQEAYTMAIEEINAQGGVKGKKLELLIEDSQEQPQLGTTAAEKLINNKEVLVLTGGRSSGVTFAVAKVANDNKMPYLIDHGSTDKATMSGWDYVFRLNPTSGMYVEALRKYLDEVVKPKKIAYLQVDNAFGEAVYEYGLKKWFTDQKYEVLYEKFNPNSLDLKAIMTKVKSFNPEVIIMTAGTDNEAVQLMKAAKEANLTAKAFIGTGAGHSIYGFYEQGKELADYVMTSGPWLGDRKMKEWQDFVKKFEQKYGHTPGEHEVEGYVSIYVIADALKRAKALDRESVKAALAETDLKTIFGRIKFEKFDGYLNQNRAITELCQWIKGKLVPVYPKEIAEQDPVFPFPAWEARK